MKEEREDIIEINNSCEKIKIIESETLIIKESVEKNLSPLLIQSIKESAINGDKKAIYAYIRYIEQAFIEEYQTFKSKENQKQFLDENLEEFEIDYFQFIDDKKDGGNEIIQKGIKELYGKIGLFYEKIGLYTEALSAYIDGIKTSEKGYIFHGNISELYLQRKLKGCVVNKNNDEKALKHYMILMESSEINGDIINNLKAVEKIGDIYKEIYKNNNIAEEYYTEALNSNGIRDKETAKRIILKLINISDNENAIEIGFKNLIKMDLNNLLLFSSYLEMNGKIDLAFFNYINAYEMLDDNGKHVIKESSNYLLMFIETTLKDKISKDIRIQFEEYGLNDESNKEGDDTEVEVMKNIKKGILDTAQIKQVFLSKISKKIENKQKLEDNEKEELFDIVIGENFYNEVDYKKVEPYIIYFIENAPNSNIYLHRILFNIINNEGSIENKTMSDILKKIYNKEELSENDKKNLTLFLNTGDIIKKRNKNKYNNLMSDIWKKIKNES